MKRPRKYNDLAAYFRWEAKWGSRLRTIGAAFFAGMGLVPLWVGVSGLMTGVVSSMERYHSRPISRAEEPAFYWFSLAFCLGMSVLFLTLAVQSVLHIRKNRSRFW